MLCRFFRESAKLTLQTGAITGFAIGATSLYESIKKDNPAQFPKEDKERGKSNPPHRLKLSPF
jgi:hypothetical protein